jgi:hypothetical protein
MDIAIKQPAVSITTRNDFLFTNRLFMDGLLPGEMGVLATPLIINMVEVAP